ncbi:MAG TPA: 4Fe-4S binding protein [Candidatus Izemoplasmatales bacterium]|nr:4Fe-4S binding protein [Bacillota bacterium]HRY77791.1 4Fe-4S binding protein [Candidatus Izemoplasmatales bacterium]
MPIKGYLTFESEKCKGCGLCVAFCPVKILYLDKNTLNQQGYPIVKITDPDKCIGCASCALMCPDSIITVEVKN